MGSVERWYLTEKGWMNSRQINLQTMIKERDIFCIVEAGRNSWGGFSRPIWDTSASDFEIDRKAEKLMNNYGRMP